jgi:hypothetical protein
MNSIPINLHVNLAQMPFTKRAQVTRKNTHTQTTYKNKAVHIISTTIIIITIIIINYTKFKPLGYLSLPLCFPNTEHEDSHARGWTTEV